MPDALHDTDSMYKKLEFNLNIYFAVYPILSGMQVCDMQYSGVSVSALFFFCIVKKVMMWYLSQKMIFLKLWVLP